MDIHLLYLLSAFVSVYGDTFTWDIVTDNTGHCNNNQCVVTSGVGAVISCIWVISNPAENPGFLVYDPYHVLLPDKMTWYYICPAKGTRSGMGIFMQSCNFKINKGNYTLRTPMFNLPNLSGPTKESKGPATIATFVKEGTNSTPLTNWPQRTIILRANH